MVEYDMMIRKKMLNVRLEECIRHSQSDSHVLVDAKETCYG